MSIYFLPNLFPRKYTTFHSSEHFPLLVVFSEKKENVSENILRQRQLIYHSPVLHSFLPPCFGKMAANALFLRCIDAWLLLPSCFAVLFSFFFVHHCFALNIIDWALLHDKKRAWGESNNFKFTWLPLQKIPAKLAWSLVRWGSFQRVTRGTVRIKTNRVRSDKKNKQMRTCV